MEKMKRVISSLLPYRCLTPHPCWFTPCFDWFRGYSLESLFTSRFIGKGLQSDLFEGHSGASCVANFDRVSKST